MSKTQVMESASPSPENQQIRKPASMHEGIPVWCDCCSCEAEPRWIEVARELGIDLDEHEPQEAKP